MKLIATILVTLCVISIAALIINEPCTMAELQASADRGEMRLCRLKD